MQTQGSLSHSRALAPPHEYAYFPGCSLESTGVSYDKSIRAVFAALGLGLHEIPDWNCCGATAYMSVKETVAFAISARNLALAEQMGMDIVAPCSACYLVLNKARRFLAERPELQERVDEALAAADLKFEGRIRVRHPLEVLLTDVGIEVIATRAKRRLEGRRPAYYYGCQIVRPERGFDDKEFPVSLDRLFGALGAEGVTFPLKVRCCGGMLLNTFEDVGVRLVREILDCAVSVGATSIVTTCPLCQFNLEMYQRKASALTGTSLRIPVIFFTQLLGLALGLDPKALGLQHHVVPFPVEALTPLEV
jgi:heterodisulfide reductase subunit B